MTQAAREPCGLSLCGHSPMCLRKRLAAAAPAVILREVIHAPAGAAPGPERVDVMRNPDAGNPAGAEVLGEESLDRDLMRAVAHDRPDGVLALPGGDRVHPPGDHDSQPADKARDLGQLGDDLYR